MIMRHEGKSISSQHHIRILFIGPTFLKLFLPSLTCGEQDSRCAEGKRALEHFNLLAHNDNIHSPSLARSLSATRLGSLGSPIFFSLHLKSGSSARAAPPSHTRNKFLFFSH